MSHKNSAKNKYAKNRYFNFVNYAQDSITISPDQLDMKSEFVVFDLECKKCKKVIRVDHNSKKEEIICCRVKAEKPAKEVKEKKKKETLCDECGKGTCKSQDETVKKASDEEISEILLSDE